MSRVKITRAQLKALGVPVYSEWPEKGKDKKKPKKVGTDLHAVFIARCEVELLPVPVPEYHFHPTRKWRADYAFPDLDLLIELEGGVWASDAEDGGPGRHTRGVGFCKDLEKYKEAIVQGWQVLRVTPDQVWKTGQAFAWIKEIAVSLGWKS